MRRPTLSMLARSLTLMVLGTSGLGCFEHDECGEGETRCEGGQLRTCHHEPGGYRFSRGGPSCNTYNGYSYGEPPALNQIPDSECKGQPGHCDGATRVLCSITRDIAVDRYECAAWSAPGACVVDHTGTPFCVAAPEPDARCEQRDWESICDGDTWIQCRSGYAELITPCSGACIDHEEHGTFCALADTRDPRCGDPSAQPYAAFCDGDTIVQCYDGYASPIGDCTPGQCTVYENGVATCESLNED